jgi:2,5-diketo-D-gluconate reductase A
MVLLIARANGMSMPTVHIAAGVEMPFVSIGTGQIFALKDAPASEIVSNWLELGGRGIDTAFTYWNQADIAKAIEQHGIARQDLFITTKVMECISGSLGAKFYIEHNLKKLNTTYIDLLLIHEPIGNCAATWRVMEEYHKKGIVRAIGVSNFNKRNLQGFLKHASIVPAVNQIMHNVYYHDDETIQYCQENNITVMAYSPLGSWIAKSARKSIFSDPTVKQIAEVHNVSAAQVALKWIVQRGITLAVLSAHKAHQANDADLFDPKFILSKSEMNLLDRLGDSLLVV